MHHKLDLFFVASRDSFQRSSRILATFVEKVIEKNRTFSSKSRRWLVVIRTKIAVGGIYNATMSLQQAEGKCFGHTDENSVSQLTPSD